MKRIVKKQSVYSLYRAMSKILHLLGLILNLLNLLKIPDEPPNLNFVVQFFPLDRFIALLKDLFGVFMT